MIQAVMKEVDVKIMIIMMITAVFFYYLKSFLYISYKNESCFEKLIFYFITIFLGDLQIELERRKRVELRSAELKMAQMKSTLASFELGMLKHGM